MEAQEMEPNLRCLLCVYCDPPHSCKSTEDFNYHLSKRHGNLASFRCGHCKKSFLHKNSLVRHIQSHLQKNDRGAEVEHSQQPSTSSSSSSAPVGVDDPPIPATSVSFDSSGSDCMEDHVPPPFNIKTEAVKFLMDLRSSGNITNTSVNLIQDYVSKFVESVVCHLREKTAAFLVRSEVAKDVSDKFVEETFQIQDIFNGLETTADQLDYFSENFSLVKPDEKFLDTRIENRFDRELKMFLPTQVPETFQSVSLIGTLKSIVKNKYVRKLIEEEKSSSDGVYRSYKDGQDFKSNRFLQKYPNALRLSLYYDDLEVANALGSKDTIHKLGCFYISIQNLPPEESSKLSSIFLLALAYAEDLKKDRVFRKILIPVIQDLKLLMSDEGVVVDLPEGGQYTLRACIVNLCADSLAAHALVGLLSPAANFFCRACMASLQDLTVSSTSLGQPRTSQLHERHVKQVERNPALRSKFGVKVRTALAEVMRVPEDCPFDAFHDLVGVIHMDIKLVLYEFICVKKLFTISHFNSSVTSFVYGTTDIKNRPSPNFMVKKLCSKGHTLRQYASQSFCLLRVFPFLVTGVDEHDKFLQLIFLLQDIMKIIFSFEVREIDIDRLEQLTYQHNNLFHDLFISPPTEAQENEENADEDEDEPEDGEVEGESEEDDIYESGSEDESDTNSRRRSVHKTKVLKKGINKLHHLLHYPRQMREKGPLIRLWCARFEGRHRIFRKHSSVQCNFKNVPKTMAQMFQLSTLGAFVTRTSPVSKLSNSDGVHLLVKHSAYRELLLSEGLSEEDSLFISKSADLRGVTYSAGSFVALRSSEGLQESRSDFGLILDIIEDSSEQQRIYLAVQKATNFGLCPRYNSYKISNSFHGPVILVCPKDLVNFRPISPWTPMGQGTPDHLYLHPRVVLF